MDGKTSAATSTTRIAKSADLESIIAIYDRVHSDLKTEGKDGEIAPLDTDYAARAISGNRCFVCQHTEDVISYAFIRDIKALEEVYPEPDQLLPIGNEASNIKRPLAYLHSLLLDPAFQSHGHGTKFVKDILQQLEGQSVVKTVILDCFSTNDKLRRFYERLGFDLLGVVPEMSWKVAVYRRFLHD